MHTLKTFPTLVSAWQFAIPPAGLVNSALASAGHGHSFSIFESVS